MSKKRTSASSSKADGLKPLGLCEFIAKASEGNAEPVHLQPMISVIERSEREPVRCVISVPCQHGKTTCVQHAIVRMLLREPSKFIAYATYSKNFSARNSKTMRQLAERCGLQLSEEHNTIAEWQTDEGGGCIATSVDGELTGYKVDRLFVDDPYKSRDEAESSVNRESVSAWFKGVAQTRVPPSGSIFVVASRWHQEDLAGELISKGWEHINLPAINAEGAALCEWGPDPADPRTLEFLNKLRTDIGEYDFQSLYQGNPRPASGQVFQEPTFAPPPLAGKITIGIDLAYTAGASADYSAVCAVRHNGSTAHVIEVARWRCSPTELAECLRGFLGSYPGVVPASYVSGPERAVFQLLAQQGIRVAQMAATGVGGSKFLRSQRTARAWNSGALTIPERAPWVDAFVREVRLFTGSASDSQDDQVDALVSAFDAAQLSTLVDPKRMIAGRRRM